MKIGTPLKIEWKDISTLTEWRYLNDAMKDLKKEDGIRYYTYGFLVRETKTHISLAATMSFKEDGEIDQISDITNIVRGCIVNIKKI